MIKEQKFIAIALPPKDAESDWLRNSREGIDYIVHNAESDEIILYTTVGFTYIHSILAQLDMVTPPNLDDLRHTSVTTDGRWALEHVSGGGEPDRMYLSSPLDHPGCKSLVGGEQLVFRRHFYGVDNDSVRTEISQRLVQALELYWLDEENAFCKLDEDGDIQPVIRFRDFNEYTGKPDSLMVTILAEELHRYMAVTETALVMKFDFTRFRPGNFNGWDNTDRYDYSEDNLHYHGGITGDASFTNGVLVAPPLLTKQDLIKKSQREWSGEGKQYAAFKAQDWKNNKLAEISCDPNQLASYFDKGSDLPFQVTPAFFNPEVLHRYKADPEKYTIEHRSIHARAGWYLKTYDVNAEGQVHTYLCYLSDLPYKEQLYWQSFNEWPKGPISERAFQTDFQGNFSTIPDPVSRIKYEITKLDEKKPDWWKARGERASKALHDPITSSPEEWANSILALDQLVIEGFVKKSLSAKCQEKGRILDKDWGTIKLLQELAEANGLDVEDAKNLIEPFGTLHFLRTKLKGHLADKEKKGIIQKARKEYKSLPAHFADLAGRVEVSLKKYIEMLS